MQLGYDKNGSLGTFTPQYNGNIGGAIWKSEGDQQKRKYDFTYDAVNRLTGADFNQYVSGTGVSAVLNKTAGIDFSVSNLTYDANGNIITMNQAGLKLNTSSVIDRLTYTYNTNSNKLLKVFDGVTPTTDNGKLGDFQDGSSGAGNDYTYDVNGNLTADNNKAISSITYNHLNLPQVITVTGKGTITYTYDAAGNKVKKIITETGATVPYNGTTYTAVTITTTTTYIGGIVYETKAYSNAALASLQYTDKLQFIGHEEGRIRGLYDNGANPNTLTGLTYDYMLRDHLGNVRMLLTEEQKTIYYPAATLEGSYSATGTAQANSMINWEKQFYNIDNTKVFDELSILSWSTETVANTKLYYNHNNIPPASPNPNYLAGVAPVQTAGSTKLYKLNATTNKTGLEFIIKVMAGDKIDIFGKSYFLNTGTVNNANSTLLDLTTLMINLLGAPANAIGAKGVTAVQLESWNVGLVPASFFRGTNGETTTIPKAYINYIFLDEQFKYVGGNFSRVGSSGVVKDHWNIDAAQMQNITVPKNGYIFVYVSNESNLDVFFDNLQVVHKPGPILEETHYYPFGLVMQGISSKAMTFGSPANTKKYQGYEHNTDFDLNTYETFYRTHDPQIGRWWQIDPRPNESTSLYAAMENNPIKYTDALGDTTIFYGYQGNRLFAVNDNGANRTVVLDEDKEDAFYNSYYGNFALVPDSKRDLSAMSKTLSAFGTSYDVASFEGFYDANSNSVPATNVDGTSTEGMTNIKINGKSIKLYAEVMGNIVMKDGVVTVGKGKSSTGDLVSSDPDKLPAEQGKVGHIHTHPVATDATITYTKGPVSTGGSFRAGPSPADRQEADKNKGGIRNVVVDSKNVYLINGWSSQTVTIPRR